MRAWIVGLVSDESQLPGVHRPGREPPIVRRRIQRYGYRPVYPTAATPVNVISFERMVRQVSDRYGREAAVRWTRATLGYQAQIDEAALRSALASGNLQRIEAVLAPSKLQASVQRAVQPSIRGAAAAAGTRGAQMLVAEGLAIDFQASHPNIVDFAQTQSANLVRLIPEETRQVIREVIAGGARGLTIEQQARAIREVVGLPPAWASAPLRLSDEIRAGQAAAATARRMSAVMKQQIRSRIAKGTVTEAFIADMQERYAKALIQRRALNIARTESARAANFGLTESWQQAKANGELPENSRRFWLVTPDDRLSEEHARIPGLNPQGRGLDENFITPDGSFPYPPSRPNCRCSIGLAFPTLTVVDRTDPEHPITYKGDQPGMRHAVRFDALESHPVTVKGKKYAFHPETSADDLAVLKADSSAYPVLRDAPMTRERFMYPDKTWTVQRERLHGAIYRQHVGKKLSARARGIQPRFVQSGGGPASGKGGIKERLMAEFGDDWENVVVVDADIVRAYFPEYAEGINVGNRVMALVTHEEASAVTKQIIKQLTKDGYHVYYDTVGGGAWQKTLLDFESFRARGYSITTGYATTSTREAMRRMIGRAHSSGRYVPPNVLRSGHTGVSRSLPEAIQANGHDAGFLLDTTVPKGADPIRVAEWKRVSPDRTELVIYDEERWQTFLAKGQEGTEAGKLIINRKIPYMMGGPSTVPPAEVTRYLAAYGDEWAKIREMPAGWTLGQPKQCYANATAKVMQYGDEGYTYVEGLAYHPDFPDLPFMHGWVVDLDGAVIDVTWGYLPKARYFGVQYDTKAYLKEVLGGRRQFAGVLGGDDALAEAAVRGGAHKLRNRIGPRKPAAMAPTPIGPVEPPIIGPLPPRVFPPEAPKPKPKPRRPKKATPQPPELASPATPARPAPPTPPSTLPPSQRTAPRRTAPATPPAPRYMRPTRPSALEQRQIVEETAAEMHVPADAVTFKARMPRAGTVRPNASVVGEFNPNTGQISISTRIPIDALQSTVAHEMEHLRFFEALKVDTKLLDDIIDDLHGLAVDDGVTGYSRAHWEAAIEQLGGIERIKRIKAAGLSFKERYILATPVSETLSEIRGLILRWRDLPPRFPARYERLLARVDRAYKRSPRYIKSRVPPKTPRVREPGARGRPVKPIRQPPYPEPPRTRTQTRRRPELPAARREVVRREVVPGAKEGADAFRVLDGMPQRELTGDAARAVTDYQSPANYTTVNQFLRGQARGILRPLRARTARKIIAKVDDVMAQTPALPEPIVVWRGQPARALDLREGQIFIDEGFTSTSLRQDIAEDFTLGRWTAAGKQPLTAAERTAGAEIFRIKVPAGSRGLWMRRGVGDALDEYVLPRGTSFRVVKRRVLTGEQYSIESGSTRSWALRDRPVVVYDLEVVETPLHGARSGIRPASPGAPTEKFKLSDQPRIRFEDAPTLPPARAAPLSSTEAEAYLADRFPTQLAGVQQDAARAYQMGESHVINAQLRGVGGLPSDRVLRLPVPADPDAHIAILDTVITQQPTLGREMIMYRGGHVPTTVGTEFVDLGYTSTTTEPAIALSAIGRTPGKVLVRVKLGPEQRGLWMPRALKKLPEADRGTRYEFEREFILPRGSRFRVIRSRRLSAEETNRLVYGSDTHGGFTAPGMPKEYDIVDVEIVPARPVRPRRVGTGPRRAEIRPPAPEPSIEGPQLDAYLQTRMVPAEGEQLRAAARYQSNRYRAINEHLRSVSTPAGRRQLEETAGYRPDVDVRLLDEAIETQPTVGQRAVVYRGGRLPSYEIGTEFVDEGYTSTTTAAKVAAHSVDLPEKVMFRITLTPEQQGLWMPRVTGEAWDFVRDEREFLLPRASRFRVVRVRHLRREEFKAQFGGASPLRGFTSPTDTVAVVDLEVVPDKLRKLERRMGIRRGPRPTARPGAAPRPAGGASVEQQRTAQKAARDAGIPPERVVFRSDVGRRQQTFYPDATHVAEYSPKTGRITLSTELPEAEVAQITAHEASHLKFHVATQTDKTLLRDIMKDFQGLTRDDGVTPYSRDHWMAVWDELDSRGWIERDLSTLPVKTQYRLSVAVDETLAEIRRAAAAGERIRVSPRFKKLLARVERSYKKAPKALRTGPGAPRRFARRAAPETAPPSRPPRRAPIHERQRGIDLARGLDASGARLGTVELRGRALARAYADELERLGYEIQFRRGPGNVYTVRYRKLAEPPVPRQRPTVRPRPAPEDIPPPPEPPAGPPPPDPMGPPDLSRSELIERIATDHGVTTRAPQVAEAMLGHARVVNGLRVVDEGIRDLKAAGVVIPDGLEFTVTHAAYPGEFSSHLFSITLDARWEKLEELAQFQEWKYAEKWWASAHPRGTMHHEVGHALHMERLKLTRTGDVFERWNEYRDWNVLLTLPSGRARSVAEMREAVRLAHTVSRYAATNPVEFVAEVFSGLIDGRVYAPEVMSLYKNLGGVVPLRPTPRTAIQRRRAA